MAAAPEPLMMTVEEYRQLPDHHGVIQELHWGQLMAVTFPKMKHTKLQSRLLELLRPLAEHSGVVAIEVPFRALPEYDLRRADVVFVSRARWDGTDDEDNLHGSPELVIEVLSRSNTQAEMREQASLCLATGAEAFWMVDPKAKTVTVLHRGAKPRLYTRDGQIPLSFFDGALEVSQIFDGTD